MCGSPSTWFVVLAQSNLISPCFLVRIRICKKSSKKLQTSRKSRIDGCEWPAHSHAVRVLPQGAELTKLTGSKWTKSFTINALIRGTIGPKNRPALNPHTRDTTGPETS